jgi:hypothetical protein
MMTEKWTDNVIYGLKQLITLKHHLPIASKWIQPMQFLLSLDTGTELFSGGDSSDSDNEMEVPEDMDDKVASEKLLIVV